MMKESKWQGKKKKKGKIKPLSHSVGWRNTAWLATVNTEPATTTTNHRLPGTHTHTHTQRVRQAHSARFSRRHSDTQNPPAVTQSHHEPGLQPCDRQM